VATEAELPMTDSPSRLTIVERRSDGVTVLVLTGEITLDDGDLAFGKKVSDLIAQGQVKIVVDLAGVTHIDSSGIGMIVAKAKAVRASHGDMKLVGLTRRTQRLLSMMKLVLVFETFDDEASAIRSFSFSVNR
jgi:anti-anti-sigma factor